ncbi:hypothetical protein ACPV4A_19530 [Vibrio rotiferianus]|uniref:hypothetical protein n=1 Tax=Vibrio rotiferianus TaxID=190895 RepID=UPI00406A5A43
MKLKTIAGLFLLFAHPVVADSALPEGAIQEGSLSNQKLIQDAMVGVVAEVATRGCESPENFLPYVKALPQGEIGSRYWREIWVVKGCEKTYPINLYFSEDGVGAANWVIE